MDKKIIAVIVAAILVVAGVAAYFVFADKDNDQELNILAAVNTDGSGLYISSDIDEKSLVTIVGTDVTYHKEGWGGLIFGTPGTQTIQYIQLKTIVEEKLDLKFALYTNGTTVQKDTVYYVTQIANADAALNNTIINGGILWQPQYQKIVDSDKFKPLALTNDLFPGHTCCVLAGVHSYTEKHPSETVRLLAAYTEAVDWVNKAMNDKSSEDYQTLVSESMRIAGKNFNKAEIEVALETVVFTYGGNGSDPLKDLQKNIVDLVNNLTEIKELKVPVSDLGFKNTTDFADKFVDDDYLKDSFNLDYKKTGKMSDIKIAVIAGDIHQIAIHIAQSQGFFEKYDLNVAFSSATNGVGVATAIQNGDSDFGLLGAPPLTITVINGKLITA